MDARELEYVEAEGGKVLQQLGYDLHNPDPRPIRLHEKLGEKLREKADARPRDEMSAETMSAEEVEQRKKLGHLLSELDRLVHSAKEA